MLAFLFVNFSVSIAENRPQRVLNTVNEVNVFLSLRLSVCMLTTPTTPTTPMTAQASTPANSLKPQNLRTQQILIENVL